MITVGLIGANGRMGQAISSLVRCIPFTRQRPAESLPEIDVFLDVSNAAALEHNLKAAFVRKTPIVVGTTGHEDLTLLHEAARSIPVFYAANFSLGMALMRRAAVELARKFHEAATLRIIESHHALKKDAPSGSALMLAKTVEEHHPAKVAIQSIRSGQTVGKHELFLEAEDESLALIHEVQNKAAFAKGAIAAAQFLAVQSPGFYTMDDLVK